MTRLLPFFVGDPPIPDITNKFAEASSLRRGGAAADKPDF
jgi:hypothetical protein